MERNSEKSVLTPEDIDLEGNDTQLTTEQRTFLEEILAAKIISIPHVVLLERVSSELRTALEGDHPPHPHGRE